MNEWKLKNLGELLGEKGYIRGPFGSSLKRDEMKVSGIPVYEQVHAIHNTREFRFHIDELKFKDLSRFQVKNADLIISCSGTVGKISIIDENDPKGIISQALLILRPDTKNVRPLYLKYFLTSELGQYHLLSASHGSVQPNIAERKIVQQIPIDLPKVEEQDKIIEILSSLDDKIDLLHRNNNTLEQLAETLFRQWFVEEAEESWEEVTLGSLCIKITKGTTPTTMGKPFVELGINFIKAESLNEFGGFIKNKFSFIDESTYDLLKRSQIKEGDILFTIAGTIGRTAIVTSSILPANTNQAVAIIRVDNEKINQTFMKYVMKSDYIKEIMETKIVHAVQPNLSLGEISDTKIKLPPKWKLDKFKLVGQNLQDKINHNNEHIQQLENLRDTLLPKLMSGAVRVEN
jgi:type I restriction enzyme S subunit